MDKEVLITLTPLGRFYFGGDATFETKDETHDGSFASYIVKSNHFPQQTSILGMLRFLILSEDEEAFCKAKQKIKDNAKAKTLIGDKSSRIQQKPLDFKMIKNIKPCFIQRQNKNSEVWHTLYTAPLDWDLDPNFDEEETKTAYINGKEITLPSIKQYNSKTYDSSFMVDADGEKVKMSDIFTEDIRVGINKDYDGKTGDGAYFKQISYRLGNEKSEDKYRFAFVATLDAGIVEQLDGKTVSLGGDNSQFTLNIIDTVPQRIYQLPVAYEINKQHKTNKITLLSDAYINPTSQEDWIYAIADIIPFRFLKTNVDATKDYNIIAEVKEGEKATRSERFDLYKKGSVFYFADSKLLKAFIEKLGDLEEEKEEKNFRKIGYNHYQEFFK